MKHTIYISPAPGKQGGWLHLDNIKYKNDTWVITRDHKVHLRHQMKAGDQPLTLHITKDQKFTFSYDDDGALKNDMTNEGRKLMAEIIRYHSQVVTEGFQNPNAGGALIFQFEDIALNDSRNFNVLAMVRNAINKVWDMTYREKMNTMYFYGQNPAGMGHKQVTIQLLDTSFGVVMRRIPYGNTGMTFIEHFVNHYQAADPVYTLKTNILKALLINGPDRTPILKREGTAIMFGDRVLGANIDEAFVWLNNNPEQRDFIVNTVSKGDVLDADDLEMAIAKMEAGDPEAEKALQKKTEVDKLRKAAKDLLVEHYWSSPPDKLWADIEDAKKVWDEVDLLGIMPDVERMKMKTLTKVKQLIEKKKKEADYSTT